MFILMIFITILSIAAILSSRTIFKHFIFNSKLYLQIKKYDKQNKLSTILRIFVCLILITLYLSLRWIPAIINIDEFNLFSANASEYRSANLSIFFMLDLCSILGILTPILFIFDWKRKILLKPIAILSILGGMATILFTLPDLYNYWDLKKFFIGSDYAGGNNGDEPLMFLMHWWMISLGFIVLVKSDYYKFKDFLIILAFIICYCAYILIVSKSLNIQSHVTALAYGDYFQLPNEYYQHQWAVTLDAHPPYAIFIDIFKTNKSWIGSLSSWISFAIIVIMIISIKNLSKRYFDRKNLNKSINQDFMY